MNKGKGVKFLGDHYITVRGNTFFYSKSGTGDPVVLLHGIPTHSGLWEGVIPWLEDSFSTYSFDLLGFGKSSKPLSHELHLKYQAELLTEAIDKLELKEFVLVGHDIGGGIGQIMAVQNHSPVKALVLLDSVCYDAWPIDLLSAESKLRMLFENLPPDVVQELYTKYIGGGLYDKTRLREVSKKYWENIDGSEETRTFLEVVKSLDNKYTMEIVPMLESLRIPTLILWGSEDKYIRLSYAYRLSEDIRNSTIKIIEKAGHFTPEDRPEEVGKIINEYLIEVVKKRKDHV